MPETRERIYRIEALRHHASGRRDGDLLDLSPVWLRWAQAFLALMLLAVLAFLFAGRVHEHARGPALIRDVAPSGPSRSAASPPMLLAVLPGHDLSRLRSGMPARVSLEGNEGVFREVTLSRVGDEVIGPAEARRRLGTSASDPVGITGPGVLVEADLPVAGPGTTGTDPLFRDGMRAILEVELSSRPVIRALLPALGASREDGHD